jgi:Tol biopolymer transport system component
MDEEEVLSNEQDRLSSEQDEISNEQDVLRLGSVDWSHQSQMVGLRKHPEWIINAPVFGTIVFERFMPQTGGRQVHSMNPDGTNVQNLSRRPQFIDGCPAWAPSRNKIVFSRQANGIAPSALWLMNPDGTGQTQLTHPPAGKWDTEPIWSPDGQKIAFHRFYEIWVVDATGANERALLSYTGLNVLDHMPTWSPDGREVAFCREFGGYSVIAAAPLQGAAPTRLITVPNRGRGDGWPTWSPKGPIAFWRNDMRDSQIWIIDSSGDTASERAVSHPDTAHGQSDQAPCWSPNGDHIAFQRIDNVTPHVWTMFADGSQQQDVSSVGKPFGNPGDFFPNWD